MTNQGPAKLIIGDDWKRKDDAPPAVGPPAGTPASAPAAPQLLVDSDWKHEAQAEREKLAAGERAKAEEKAKRAEGGAVAGAAGEKIDFQALLGTLATQALMYMGAFPDESGRAMVSLEHARFNIELLTVLEDKTKGNLTKAEGDELVAVLHELRMRYVDISKAVMKAAKDRAAQGGVPGTLPGNLPGV